MVLGRTRQEGAVARLPTPTPNLMGRPYGHVSVQEFGDSLNEASIRSFVLGREVYWQTDYLVLCREHDIALVAVLKESCDPLFSPVIDLAVLAEPARARWIESPGTDVGNATAMARAARAHGRPGTAAYVVRGLFEHVNFIWEPALITIRVNEVVPPQPPKLFAMAQQVVAFDEDLPPIDLVLDAVDIGELALEHPADRYLLPCRGSGVHLAAPCEFLDTRPPVRHEWLLLGCERSNRIHRHFYGDEPARVDICPRRRDCGTDLRLTKCCLRERGVEVAGTTAVVPWGSSLDEVRHALRRLTGVDGD